MSEVVETSTGYHVLYRRPPVAPATVSGRHIVIGHDAAPWLEVMARGLLQERGESEARALADQIYEQARAHPVAFAQLVARYSEHRDAARGGDFGTWSTREPTWYPREVETLEGLALGEVAKPIDTLFGIQIIQRVEDPPRQRYAMTRIQLRFDLQKRDPDPASKPAAFRQARELSAALHQEPTVRALSMSSQAENIPVSKPRWPSCCRVKLQLSRSKISISSI